MQILRLMTSKLHSNFTLLWETDLFNSSGSSLQLEDYATLHEVGGWKKSCSMGQLAHQHVKCKKQVHLRVEMKPSIHELRIPSKNIEGNKSK